MVVKLIDDKILWDKHIEESPYGTLFHLWDYLKIIEKHSGCKLYTYGIYRGEELACVFPLFVKAAMGIKIVCSPPPGMAIPYLGFVMSTIYDKLKQRRKESYVNSAIDEMEAEIKKIGPNFTYISTVNGFVDVRPFRWNGYNVQMHYSSVIDLKRPLDKILSNFDPDLKLKISGSEKLPLPIRPTNDVDAFYGIMERQFKRQGLTPPLSNKEYLKDVLAAFPDNVKLNILYDGDTAVDMVAYCQYKKRLTFWIWSAGQGNDQKNMEYIAWNYIKEKKADGIVSFEIPGASVKRNWDFMSKFNAPLEYNFSIIKNDLKGRIYMGMNGNRIKVHV
jgi:Acetyltransferase (GNAT) domain